MDHTALVSLAFIASITPGPNNLMLWASGLNHGFRRTLRHLAGVSLGFALLLFLVALGLGQVFERYGRIEVALKLTGGTYLAYLAYRIFTAGTEARSEEVADPLTFTQAALFQWVNPKAWVMATTAASTLLDTSRPIAIAALGLTGPFWAVNLPCISLWAVSGSASTRWLDDPRRVRVANRTLGLLLGATVLLLFR